MYEKLNKKARGCMLVASVVGCTIATIILGVIWFALGTVKLPISKNYIWLLVAIIWIWNLISPFVRYELYRYRFTDEEIDIKEGFISIERNIVPIERLHKVAILSGPIDRMFGLAKVVVTTAGGDVTIRFLEVEKAEAITENLKKRINSYAIKERNEKPQVELGNHILKEDASDGLDIEGNQYEQNDFVEETIRADKTEHKGVTHGE